MKKINAVNMGFSAAIIAAGGMLLLSLGNAIGVYTGATVQMAKWHMFYSPDVLGTITGMIEGAIISFIFVYLLILVYNLFQGEK